MSTMTYDLLVLGGGMAGLSAAAWTVANGGSVVLVEKGELGGSAMRAGFIWTAPTYEALREAIPSGDPELARALIDGFGPAIDWVRSTGPNALDGSLELWVDGVSGGRLTGLDDSVSSVDFVRLGALSLKS